MRKRNIKMNLTHVHKMQPFNQEIRILNPAAYTKTNNKTPTVTKMHLSKESKVGVTLEKL